jgi:hypothetical protein
MKVAATGRFDQMHGDMPAVCEDAGGGSVIKQRSTKEVIGSGISGPVEMLVFGKI